MPKSPTPREVLAELTWAKLYATRIQNDLDLLVKVLDEVEDISARPQVLETATLLREHLKLANAAIAELRAEARLKPPKKKSPTPQPALKPAPRRAKR